MSLGGVILTSVEVVVIDLTGGTDRVYLRLGLVGAGLGEIGGLC